MLPGAMLTRSHVFSVFKIPICKSNLHKKSFAVSGMLAWNQLDVNYKASTTLFILKNQLNKKSQSLCCFLTIRLQKQIMSFW